MDILALLQPIEDSLSKATLRQMSRVFLAILAATPYIKHKSRGCRKSCPDAPRIRMSFMSPLFC